MITHLCIDMNLLIEKSSFTELSVSVKPQRTQVWHNLKREAKLPKSCSSLPSSSSPSPSKEWQRVPPCPPCCCFLAQ